MHRTIQPLCRRSTYSGAVFAFTGAAMNVFLLPFALVPVGLWEVPSASLRTALFAAAMVALIVLLGLPRATRLISVSLANRLLGAELPEPAKHPLSRWSTRLRTSVWLQLHVGLGGLSTGLVLLLLMAGLVLPATWLSGGDRIACFGLSVDIVPGWRGAWVWPAAAAALVVSVQTCAAATAFLRVMAQRLLGHSAAERLAELEERQLILAQRNRLAQELHDSIGHTLTASTIQAAVAGELLEADPDAARRALRSIEESSRSALDDLDHVLGTLREEASATAPERTLANVNDLFERIRQAGTELQVDIVGDLTHVPTTVSREAYRIVQEGLTNAMRHGDQAVPVAVTVSADIAWLEIVVVNAISGRHSAATRTGGGRGLVGVTERVRLLRGEVVAGPAATDPDRPETTMPRLVGGGCWKLVVRVPLRLAA
ncbi:sensor histidine kinase [Kitasatospora sp. NPDC056138]|uniref:sensor histidine kinase n=1 Tax=Kitasatospora sp. NPDC056138 TaxID=3345724 RepID=UPI0035DB832A